MLKYTIAEDVLYFLFWTACPCQSVLTFLGISALIFSELLHGNKNLETEKSDENGFSFKKFVRPTMGKKDTKWRFFLVFIKFAGSSLK